jgi:hypothetical protein
MKRFTVFATLVLLLSWSSSVDHRLVAWATPPNDTEPAFTDDGPSGVNPCRPGFLICATTTCPTPCDTATNLTCASDSRACCCAKLADFIYSCNCKSSTYCDAPPAEWRCF